MLGEGGPDVLRVPAVDREQQGGRALGGVAVDGDPGEVAQGGLEDVEERELVLVDGLHPGDDPLATALVRGVGQG